MKGCCVTLGMKISFFWNKFVRERITSKELRKRGKKMESKRDLVMRFSPRLPNKNNSLACINQP